MMILRLISCLFLICSTAAAAAPQGPTSAIRCTLELMHDGDTIVVTLHLPFGIDLPHRTIRAYGYDAWEIDRTRQTVHVTEAEIAQGKLARDDLFTLLEASELWAEDSGASDPYGRTSATLWARQRDRSWINIADWMKARGHVRVIRPPSPPPTPIP
jgi:endonuclease YncB( thermonuclease family)